MSYDLTLNSAATFATSPVSGFGQALQAGGSAVLSGPLFSAAGTSIEVECVVAFSANPSTNSIIVMQDYLFALAFTTAGKFQAWAGYVGGSNASVVSPNTYADGKPHRVALIYSNATLQLLVDGAVVATAAASSAVQSAISWTKQSFGIGLYPGSSKPYTNAGVIDEVAVFSPARDSGAYTPSTAPYTGTETGLAALYHLDGNASNSVVAAAATGSCTLSGPARIPAGTATTFTITVVGTALSSTATFTPSDSGAGGAFSPATVAIAAGATSGTFTYTPKATGSVSLSLANDASLTNPSALAATVYTALSLGTITATAGASSVTIAATVAMSGGDGSASGYKYRLYRATSASGLPPASSSGTVITTWTGPSVGDHGSGWVPSFSDATGVTGTTYYYAIEGSDTAGDIAYFASNAVVYPQGSTTSTTYTLGGPTALTLGSPSTYTVTPNGSSGPTSAVVVTPKCAVAGAFSPATVTFAAASTTSQTFTFTPSALGTGNLSATNNAGLVDPSALSVTATSPYSTTYTISGSSTLAVGVPTTYTVAASGTIGPKTAVIVTPTSTVAGTFSPTTVTLPASSVAAQSFTFTPTASGSGALTSTNSGSLTDPQAQTLTVTAANSQTVVAPNNTMVTYSPYNWLITATAATSANPGAYLNFCFTGSSLQINCDISRNSGPMPQIWVTIDGQTPQLMTAAASLSPVIPTATASWPVHTVEILFKSATCTQSRWSPQATSLTITGFVLARGASVSAIQAQTKNILIYGDSITEGYLALSAVGSSTDAAVSDASLAWSFRQRAALGANVGVVAFTGSGLTVTGNGSVPPLTTTWNALWSGQPRSFSPVPDIIVLNEGTNDGAKGATAAAVQAAMTTVLQNLIAACPATRIVVLQPYQGGGTYMNANDLARVTTGLQAAVAAVGSSNVTFVSTTGWFTAAMASADGTHPLGCTTVASIAPRAASALAPVVTSSSTKTYVYY